MTTHMRAVAHCPWDGTQQHHRQHNNTRMLLDCRHKQKHAGSSKRHPLAPAKPAGQQVAYNKQTSSNNNMPRRTKTPHTTKQSRSLETLPSHGCSARRRPQQTVIGCHNGTTAVLWIADAAMQLLHSSCGSAHLSQAPGNREDQYLSWTNSPSPPRSKLPVLS